MDEFVKISSTEQLLAKLQEEPHTAGEFFIQLNLGQSWKTISLMDDDKLWVLNQIDETEEEISISQLGDTNIGKAMERGQFYFAWF